MKIKLNRRGMSPIVATILMFVLILAAIGISLAYMFPSIDSFKDKSYNSSNNLYFIALDSTIQEMINNPPPATKQFYFNQEQGQVLFDSSWKVYFLLNDITGIQSLLALQDNVTRLIHKSTAIADFERGEHRYVIGPQNQDYTFINNSNTIYNEIGVLNASRTYYDSSYLNLALYYRYVLSIQYSSTVSTEIYDVDIVHVNLIENQTLLSDPSQKFVTMELSYLGTRQESGGSMEFTNDIQGEVRLVDEYGLLNYEYPLYFPINSNYISHLINVNIIHIDVSISLS